MRSASSPAASSATRSRRSWRFLTCEYRLVEPDLTDAGRLLRSAFHGYITLEANGGFSHSRAVRRSWERALDGLHLLLENWPAESPPPAAEGQRR